MQTEDTLPGLATSVGPGTVVEWLIATKPSPHTADRTLHVIKDDLYISSKDIDDRTSLSLAGELGHKAVPQRLEDFASKYIRKKYFLMEW